MTDYTKISDEELIRRLRGGEVSIVDYLLEKYKPLVRSMCRTRFMTGGDNEDLIQEGMIGLFKAVQSFDEQKNTLFVTFARLCIERQQMSAITRANRLKNNPLNNSEQLNEEVIEGVEKPISTSPENMVIDRENTYEMLISIVEDLSKMEQQVFQMYIEGFDYIEIAERLGKTPKSIDNAIQRIRQKAKKKYHL